MVVSWWIVAFMPSVYLERTSIVYCYHNMIDIICGLT